MLDKQALYDDLTDAFIHYQYGLEHPMATPLETREVRVQLYRTNSMFNARVQSLVGGVIHIIDKHISEDI